MLRFRGLAVVALAVALVAPGCGGGGGQREAGPATLVGPGETLPDLAGKAPDGREVHLADLVRGKLAVVDVWATWCAPCLMAMPELEKLHRRYENEGFTVVGIMIDRNASRIGPGFVRDWHDGAGIAYPVIFDDDGEQLRATFGPVTGVPLLFLVDRDGKILERHTGTGDLGALLRRVAELMEAPPAAAGEGDSPAAGEAGAAPAAPAE